MLIENQDELSKVVELSKQVYQQKLSTVFEMNSDKTDKLLNVLQEILFWLIPNFETENLEFPLTVTAYKKIKKFYDDAVETCNDSVPEKINAIIKDIILKNDDESDYYNILGTALFGKDPKSKKHFNEIFILSLTSKFKNIGVKRIAVVFKEKTELLLMDDGTYFNCDLESFLKDFFGKSKDYELSKKIRELVETTRTHFEAQQTINELCANYTNQISDDYELTDGAVMFCDFLGWKGLWKNDTRHKALKDANSLVKQISDEFDRLTTKILPLNKYFPISNLISISDTIVLMTPRVNDIDNSKLISLYADIGKFILEKSIELFPLRGAFTIGEFGYSNNIMIGPAIDEAASWHEMTDWIGIILTPTAQFEYDLLNEESSNIVKYSKIPLKVNKDSLKYCLKWQEPDNAIIKKVRDTKALIPEIANKYINTYNFFNFLRLNQSEVKSEGDNKNEK